MSVRFFVCLLLVLICVLLSGCEESILDESTSNQPPASGLSVVGGPSLSASFVNTILSTAQSPATGTGQDFYSQSVSTGIDDAYALAFFQHESSFGRFGVAASSLNIGNLRCLGPDYSDLQPSCVNNFAYFPSWSEGIAAWYRLIKGPMYAGSGLVTVPQIIHRYAPSADYNNEWSYTQAVESSVSLWREGKVSA